MSCKVVYSEALFNLGYQNTCPRDLLEQNWNIAVPVISIFNRFAMFQFNDGYDFKAISRLLVRLTFLRKVVPLHPILYSETGVYRGIHYFILFLL